METWNCWRVLNPAIMWVDGMLSGRRRVRRVLDKLKGMLDACDASGDRRTRSMLLVQFQSLSGLRELLTMLIGVDAKACIHRYDPDGWRLLV